MQRSIWVSVVLLLCLSAFADAQTAPAGTGQVAPAPAQGSVTLPSPAAANAVHNNSEISLDVVVSDKAGKSVSGLTAADFTLLDNNHPTKILSFNAYNGTAQAADPPVEGILLFDTVNIGFDAISYTRQQVENFLRQKGGHLAQPMSIEWLTNDGVEVAGSPTTDGNALAAQLDASEARLRSISRAAGVYGAIERYQFSVQMLAKIAMSELDKPGRKLLIWAGPGWPLLDGPGINLSMKGQRALFGQVVAMSTLLREARVDVYSISEGMPGPATYLYESFLKGVKKEGQANPPNLGLKVLAVQSGGRVLPPTNDLTISLNNVIQDAGTFYKLSFAPPPADGPNEYHELKLRIEKSGMTVHTNTGYYNQPEKTSAP